jgi:hypothetical protein
MIGILEAVPSRFECLDQRPGAEQGSHREVGEIERFLLEDFHAKLELAAHSPVISMAVWGKPRIGIQAVRKALPRLNQAPALPVSAVRCE